MKNARSMDFNNFLDNLPKIAKEKLLGITAHIKMAPFDRIEIMKNFNPEIKKPKKAAVLMLLYPKNKETHLVLIVRNEYPGVHSSQIAFPGGKYEIDDASLEDTALRETWEEVGVESSKIKIIKPFTEIYIPPSNFMVYPFLGYSEEEIVFIPSPDEVAAIIELPITELLNEQNVVSVNMTTSYAVDIDVPAFQMQNHIVWGATAMIISELKEVLKSTL